jgi:hypothetical protein
MLKVSDIKNIFKRILFEKIRTVGSMLLKLGYSDDYILVSMVPGSGTVVL